MRVPPIIITSLSLSLPLPHSCPLYLTQDLTRYLSDSPIASPLAPTAQGAGKDPVRTVELPDQLHQTRVGCCCQWPLIALDGTSQVPTLPLPEPALASHVSDSSLPLPLKSNQKQIVRDAGRGACSAKFASSVSM